MPITQRLWRLRKRQHVLDAVVQQTEAATGGNVALEFRLNGRRLTIRRCASCAQAMAAATEKRNELERAGWATHW